MSSLELTATFLTEDETNASSAFGTLQHYLFMVPLRNSRLVPSAANRNQGFSPVLSATVLLYEDLSSTQGKENFYFPSEQWVDI